jgi:hypothetical protein
MHHASLTTTAIAISRRSGDIAAPLTRCLVDHDPSRSTRSHNRVALMLERAAVNHLVPARRRATT